MARDSCNVEVKFLEDYSNDQSDDYSEHHLIDESEEHDYEFLETYATVGPEEFLEKNSEDEEENTDELPRRCSNNVTEEFLNSIIIRDNANMEELLIDDPEESITITDEFINDLSTEMEYDENTARMTRSTEDGMGKIKFTTYNSLPL